MGLGLNEAGDRGSHGLPETTPPAGRFTPPPPAELAPHFPELEILDLIGQGGMGAVYKARQRELDRVVAIKILPPAAEDPSFAERFSREAKTLARMNHPHIVAIHDVGQRSGYYFFVMEFVDGVNLRQAIQTKTLSPQESLAVVRQICDALDYAHGLGIVHRDIKPDNVLIDKQGRVKIADFGLAKLLSKSAADITLTQANQAMGTPHYMAPEQLSRPLEVDHRADIYSLGVVFYELLTGELPMGRFDPPSRKLQVDVRLDEIVLKTLEREPERRYQQARHVKTEIESVHLHRASIASKPAPASLVPDPVLRRRAMITSFVLISFSQAALLGLTWGYLGNAEWYFKKEAPYSFLQGWWCGAGLAGFGWMAWWWYLLAKDPDAPRNLNDFLRTWQLPNPRNRIIALSAFGFLVVWFAAVGTAFAFTSNDDIHTVVFTSGFLLGPYVLMAAVWMAFHSAAPSVTEG
jgi:serine/threonine protein kinase